MGHLVRRSEVLLDSFDGQAVNSKVVGYAAAERVSGGSLRNFLHARLPAWLLHVLVSNLSPGRAAGGVVNLNVSANDLAGLKVMVIDDSKTIRRTAETLLKKEGCEVLTAVDGFEALAKISDQKPAIIFVDIMMPRLDGYQTCALIKNNPLFRATPVIMLSSKDGLFDKARGRIVGAEQYLTKPFTRDELLGAIHRHVSTVPNR
jgi:twitching motility two-component system response regulator PilG